MPVCLDAARCRLPAPHHLAALQADGHPELEPGVEVNGVTVGQPALGVLEYSNTFDVLTEIFFYISMKISHLSGDEHRLPVA